MILTKSVVCRGCTVALLALSLSLFVTVNSSTAQERFFTGATSSDYDTGSNWDSGSVPADPESATIGDDVVNSAAVATLMTTPAAHFDLSIGKNGGSGELNHSAGSLTSNNWAFVGVDSTANSASSGTYNLTGSASYTQVSTGEQRFEIGGRGDTTNPAQGLVHVDTTGSMTTANTTVGVNGDGRFELVNGTHNVEGFINVGSNGFDVQEPGVGVYEQTGGVLNVNGGTAPFGSTGWFSIGNFAGSTGTYNMSGGTMNMSIADFLSIGENGDGTMSIDGTSGSPDVNVTGGGMVVGRNVGSTGAINILSDGATIDTTLLDVGPEGTGTLSFTSASGVSPIAASADVLLGDANLVVDLETNPVVGDVLLVDVGGTLMGEFNGLVEGASVPGSDGRFITYQYGDGNNIALVPEPAALTLLGLAMIGFGVWRRK